MDFFLKSVLLMLVIEVGYISAHYSSSEMYTPGANGSIVVHYVIKKVESALGGTNELMDRIAFVETHYGQDAKAYQNGSNGGIWRVDERNFNETQNVSTYPGLKQHFAKIKSEFGIDWPTVSFEDLRKPLYSGLAARLKMLIVRVPIPPAKQYHRQAVYSTRYYKRRVSRIIPVGTGVGRFLARVLSRRSLCCGKGQKLFVRKGAQCHTTGKGGEHKQGPNLYCICGRPAAQSPGFPYSQAMIDSGIIWSRATLNEFLKDPQKMVPGTKMVFAGIKKAKDRKCLVDYLCGCI